MTLGGIILCGGLSTRMGRAKALLPWRGKTMIEHVVGVLREAVGDVVVVSSGDLKLPALDARVVRDREPKLGPLGGIREGLEATHAELCYVTGTDAPFLTSAFVKKVLSFDTAAAPEIDGFVQSLSAAYPRSLAPMANDLIAANRMRPLFLLEAGAYRTIAPSELPDFESLRNLNTPEDYLKALPSNSRATVELAGTLRAKCGSMSIDVDCGPLGDVLHAVEERLRMRLDGSHGVTLNGARIVREPGMPIGPGDRIAVTDAGVGA